MGGCSDKMRQMASFLRLEAIECIFSNERHSDSADGGRVLAKNVPNRLRRNVGPLKSWKAIAAYLNRDVRTAQRWEATEGLPVHRHQHARGATVYAVPSEIDAWLASRDIDSPINMRFGRLLFESRSTVRLIMAVGTGLSVAVIAMWQLFSDSRPQVDQPESAIGILVADIENRTGEVVIEDLASAAIEREFSDSTNYFVVPPSRAAETLTLMRQAPDLPVNREIAQRIAQHDSIVAGVLTISIEQAGNAYVPIMELQQAENLAVIESVTARFDRVEDAADVLGQMAATLRRSADDRRSQFASPRPVLERVTTKSPEALRIYSEAMTATLNPSVRSWNPVVESLLRDAIAYDEDFASALILLAWSISNQSPETVEHAPIAERALELADTVSDPERYFIRGSYFQMIGEDEEAEREYRVLAQIQPDHYWGISNLRGILREAGRIEEAARYAAILADLQPTSAVTNAFAAQMLARNGQPELAEAYVSRARDMIGQAGTYESQRVVARMYIWRAEFAALDKAWAAGDAAAVSEQLEDLLQRLDETDWDGPLPNAYRVVLVNLVLGRIQEAQDLLATHVSKPTPYDFLSIPVGLETKSQAVARHGIDPDANWGTLLSRVIEAARDGDLIEAETRLDQALAKIADDPYSSAESSIAFRTQQQHVHIATAELLRAQGEHAAAEAEYREALAYTENDVYPDNLVTYFQAIAAEGLAQILDERGDRSGAISLLKESGALTPASEVGGANVNAIFWIRLRWQLAELLRDEDPLGATSIESELRRMLALADNDHPIARALRDRAEADTN